MIKITLEFANHNEATEALARVYAGTASPVTAEVVIPPAPKKVPPPPTERTVEVPPAPPSTTEAPPQAISAKELNDAMVAKAGQMGDNGAACLAILTELGVDGIAKLTDAQRVTAFAKIGELNG